MEKFQTLALHQSWTSISEGRKYQRQSLSNDYYYILLSVFDNLGLRQPSSQTVDHYNGGPQYRPTNRACLELLKDTEGINGHCFEEHTRPVLI